MVASATCSDEHELRWSYKVFHTLTTDEKKATINGCFFSSNVRERIRTPDTLVRSQVLYPAELHTHTCRRLTSTTSAIVL